MVESPEAEIAGDYAVIAATVSLVWLSLQYPY